jgi:hypothetical protein
MPEGAGYSAPFFCPYNYARRFTQFRFSPRELRPFPLPLSLAFKITFAPDPSVLL